MKFRYALIPILMAAMPATAEPTPVTVHVISKDAKFIGDSMGGAEVVLRDAKTGRLLAKGVTKGGTGYTARIMQSTGRSAQLTTPDAAAFNAVLEITRPTLVNLEVTGPIARPGSAIRVMSQRWMVPGQSVTIGDGWVVELPGLAISPTAKFTETGGVVTINAKVELLCGCPITPGGIWDANDYRVTASIWQRGRLITESSLGFIEAPGGFAGQIVVPVEGKYRLFISAHNIKTGNSGLTELQRPM